jgi:hypothetical protein
MATAANNATEWVPQVFLGLSKLPTELTLSLSSFLLSAFAIWAVLSIARGRQ